jgi:hypothetical protein
MRTGNKQVEFSMGRTLPGGCKQRTTMHFRVDASVSKYVCYMKYFNEPLATRTSATAQIF